jgi:hypothetical protein
MALDQYEGVAEIQIDNQTLAEAVSVNVNHNANNNPVVTMKKGLAGRSRGAYQVEVQVENAVPRAGLEAEWVEKCRENEDVVITHILAGKTYTYEGWIDTVSTQQGTDTPASLSFTAMCGPPRIT